MLPVRHLTKLSFLDCFLSEMPLRRGVGDVEASNVCEK